LGWSISDLTASQDRVTIVFDYWAADDPAMMRIDDFCAVVSYKSIMKWEYKVISWKQPSGLMFRGAERSRQTKSPPR